MKVVLQLLTMGFYLSSYQNPPTRNPVVLKLIINKQLKSQEFFSKGIPVFFIYITVQESMCLNRLGRFQCIYTPCVLIVYHLLSLSFLCDQLKRLSVI